MENVQEIACLRERIDAVDKEIVRLITQRAKLAKAVGIAKGGAPVYRPEREREIIDRVVEQSVQLDSPIEERDIARLYREIIAVCRGLEARPTVGYLGPAGTYTEMAVVKMFGEAIESVPCATMDEVFHFVEGHRGAFGVVPIENSTQGTVTRTMDLLLSTSLTIIGETSVEIRHNLLAKTKDLSSIRRIVAHPQALSQCRAWLSSHAGHAELVSASSNAAAAKMAQEDPLVAAIASQRAAQLYGLNVLAEGIQDDSRNRTRFIALGHNACPAPRGAKMRTSLVFSVHNEPGALYKALAHFERHGVSMTRLESRPARNGAWEYNFYVDIEGDESVPGVRDALAALEQATSFIKLLGSFPVAAYE